MRGEGSTKKCASTGAWAARFQPDIGLEPQTTRAETKLESRRATEPEMGGGAEAMQLSSATVRREGAEPLILPKLREVRILLGESAISTFAAY